MEPLITDYFRYLCLLERILERQPKSKMLNVLKMAHRTCSTAWPRDCSSFYVENESGATLERPKLMQLIEDAHEGDVILVEQIDRLARLNQTDWNTLKRMLSEKKLAGSIKGNSNLIYGA